MGWGVGPADELSDLGNLLKTASVVVSTADTVIS